VVLEDLHRIVAELRDQDAVTVGEHTAWYHVPDLVVPVTFATSVTTELNVNQLRRPAKSDRSIRCGDYDRPMRTWALLALVVACGDNRPPASSCDLYVRPTREPIGCSDPSDPRTLVACDTGSALVGAWAIDADGLPAYDFLVDERCDEAAHAWSPSPRPLRDPLHVVGDGFGTVAMAHASGGLDLYMQDRGHAWPIRVDTWRDDEHPEFAPQLGAAIGYVVVDHELHSTRFEDLPVGNSQTRRFGVGYVETVTQVGELTITRRTFAQPGTRALVTEITVDNASSVDHEVGLVELEDVNLYELPVELVTSDLLVSTLTTTIERRRRALDAGFTQHGHYDAGMRIASIATVAKSPPVGPDDPSEIDYYPATVWLAPVDDAAPDAIWLADSELWDDTDRAPPARAAAPGTAAARDVDLDGANQPGLLAARIATSVPAGGRITRRFAFGVVPSGTDPSAAVAMVRASEPDGRAAAAAWRDRLVWAALPGLPAAGAVQRELAWSSYAIQALATYDSYHQRRLLGQGGSYKFIHGIDGAIGDYALFAEAVTPIDPALARDTLALSLATQRAPSLSDGGRFPYATTGVGDYTDMARYDRRSDAYFLLPSEIARYVALTRDDGFLDAEVPFWPRSAGESATVLDHLRLTQQFADTTLGFGAHGLVAMGTNDYADGVLQTATEPATPTGTSSTFNAWLLVGGYPLAADVVASRDATLAQRYTDERADQLSRLDQFAWNGQWYERGFVDSGNPLGADNLYLEPQVLPIVANAIPSDRRTALLDLIARDMDTAIGPMTTVGAASGGIDAPQVGGVWPVASAWLTEAYGLADPALGWDSLIRNTLFQHAESFPSLWYGVWSGPDSYYGPDAERPGEADAHLATALTDYPVFNTHAHASLLRALFALAGVHGTRDGIAIAPLLPTDAYEIVWPRMSLSSTPTSRSGSLTPMQSGSITFRVRAPATLTRVEVESVAVTSQRDGDDVVFTATAIADVPVHWQILP